MRLTQDVSEVEFIVVDNFGCDWTREYLTSWVKESRYIRYDKAVGTSMPRDLIFREATGEAVMCLDCHVLLVPGALARLKNYYSANPNCLDLLQGPLLNDDLLTLSTHFDPVWDDHMWGKWGYDARGHDPGQEPFEIPMQGLGLFSCRKAAWLGFNDSFRGFGGEEGYIHEKFRQAGRRCLCLPWLRWMHRFGRPYGASFPLDVGDRIRNYLIGHDELNLDLTPIFKHFAQYVDDARLRELAREVLGDRNIDQYLK
jgi:glycosyltransferase involved in cell wall biosynthesis